MVLELSFDSSIDDEIGYESALSADLEDDTGISIYNDGEDSASLDTMIFNFRASSRKSNTARDASVRSVDGFTDTSLSSSTPPQSQSLRYPSPPRSSKLKVTNGAKRSFQASSKLVAKPATAKPKPRSLAHVRPAATSDESDREDEEAVRPMPKLTQIPRPKPSLIQIPKLRLREIPKPKASVSLAAASKRDPTEQRTNKPTLSLQKTSLQQAARPAARTKDSLLAFPSPLPSASSLSSFISEDIESPDTLGDDSIDDLIGNDIDELHRLISSGRESKHESTTATRKAPKRSSSTSDEMTTALKQSTRFRKDKLDRCENGGKPSDPPGSPASRPAFPSSFKLQMPTRRRRFNDDEDPPPAPPPDRNEEEDSFAEEILKLRVSARKQKEMEAAENKKKTKKQQAETRSDSSVEATEISAETTANIRQVSNTIDEVLLLALQPFEKRRKQLDEEEGGATADNSNPPGRLVANMQSATLPRATQAIVETLDLTFGSMTQQRNAELKAEKDAQAAAKAAEDATKKDAEAKQQAAERAEKQREMEILSLLPMRGRLLASSADVDNVLYRLECAENQASRTIDVLAGRAAPKENEGEPQSDSTLQSELAKLRQHTMQRIQKIELRLQQSNDRHHPGRFFDWERTAFEANEVPGHSEEEHDNNPETIDEDDNNESDGSSFHEILQRQVVENLDLTIVKLRHVLGIDDKEAAEAKAAKDREDAAKQKKQLEEERESTRKQQEREDAENARKRVMGLTSLDQLSSWAGEDRLLREELSNNGLTVDRLISSLGVRADTLHNTEGAPTVGTPSCFDTHQALARFDSLKQAMNDGDQLEPEEAAEFQQDEHHHQQRSPRLRSSQHRYQHQGDVRTMCSQLDFDTSSEDDAAHDHKSLCKRVQFASQEEPEDDTPSFETLFSRFHDATSSPSLSAKRGSDLRSKSPGTPSTLHTARQELFRHKYPTSHHLNAIVKNPAATHEIPKMRRNNSDEPPPGKRRASRRPWHQPRPLRIPRYPVADHPQTHRSHRERANKSNSSHAFMDRIQQQIARLQADRRQKDAWVSQRRAS